MRRQASLAPPWAGPQSDETPAAMQAKGLACDDPTVRTVLVEAFFHFGVRFVSYFYRFFFRLEYYQMDFSRRGRMHTRRMGREKRREEEKR
jgi:hypothetical protein